jgi:hypothetical protein
MVRVIFNVPSWTVGTCGNGASASDDVCGRIQPDDKVAIADACAAAVNASRRVSSGVVGSINEDSVSSGKEESDRLVDVEVV